MGTFRKKVKIVNPKDVTSCMDIEMVVDSGATYSQVSHNMLTQLGIEKRFKRSLKIAMGEIIKRDTGIIQVVLNGETIPTLVVFGDKDSEPLLGAVTLEEFGLGVDPVNKVLVPVPELML